MELRRFGSTDLRVSEFGLGCARIGGIFQTAPGTFLELLSSALDSGINFYDTADIYSQGESEALLGRAFRGRRDQVIIASKAGYVLPAQRRFVARLKPLMRPLIRTLGIRRERLPAAVRGSPSQDFSPAHLRRAVEGSLRRLRTDRLDLFQLHSPTAAVVERGAWGRALEDLKRQGKIRYFGISCDTVEAGLAALQCPGLASIQATINMLEQRALHALLPVARERDVAVIARECLANGLLVKDAAALDLRAYCPSPAAAGELRERLRSSRQVATDQGRTLADLALDFVNHLDGVPVALIGARTADQLRSLLSAYGRRRSLSNAPSSSGSAG
jgi:aryl-alcohol dehydrogenase-like predicted oxidoreductase